MATNPLEIGTVLGGKYRVQRQLGEGGMGTVYLVQHVKTDERLALKILNPSVVKNPAARERFRREARTPARIDSDHIARVIDSDIATEHGDLPYIVMEYLRGKNLQDVSEELGPLPPAEVLTYLRQIALALNKAHTLGIVHRDLKPENLFLTMRDDGSPCVKVLDFGVAKLTGATSDLANVKATSTGDIFGTPLYMAPEQCKSEADKVGIATDVWALGLVAHRLLTAREFWNANTLTHLIAEIAYEPYELASQRGSLFGRTYDLWFATCCAREPEDRFTSAGAAVEALADALGLVPDALMSGPFSAAVVLDQPSTDDDSNMGLKQTAAALTRDADALRPAGVPRRRSPWLLLGAVGLLAIGGTAAWFMRSAPPEASTTSTNAAGAGTSAAPQASSPPSASASATASSSAITSAHSAQPAPSADPPAAPRVGQPAAQPTVRPPPAPVHTAPPAQLPPQPPPGDPLSGRH